MINAKIKIRGHLDRKWENWFDGMMISYESNNTIIKGFIEDDAKIYGILNLIRDLNLKLISVKLSFRKNAEVDNK